MKKNAEQKTFKWIFPLIVMTTLSACQIKSNDENLATPSPGNLDPEVPSNQKPVALALSSTTRRNTSVVLVLSATDADGDDLTYEIVSDPANGAISGTLPDLIYTPNPDFLGVDSFTFKASDGTIDSNAETVSIVVNSAALYFCNTQADNTWATVENWYMTADCETEPAGRLPENLDAVVSFADFSDQPEAITLTSFEGVLAGYGDSQTSNITIADGGILSVTEGNWFGSSAADVVVTFSGISLNFGNVAGNATFNDTSGNFGQITGHATFNDNTVQWDAILTGNATFNGNSNCIGYVMGNATFNENSYLTLSFGNRDDWPNFATVGGNAVFNDASSNDNGIVVGTLTCNTSGPCTPH